jgi:hypothetical protein
VQDGIVIALLVVAMAAWVATLVSTIAANRSFYPWHGPLCDAGVLPPNGRGPAFSTWRRLLGQEPEPDPDAEALRREAKRYALRMFASAAVFVGCVGLAAIVMAL